MTSLSFTARWWPRRFVTGRNDERSGPWPYKRSRLIGHGRKHSLGLPSQLAWRANSVRKRHLRHTVTKALACLRIRFSILADARAASAAAPLEVLSRSPAGARCWQPLLRASALAHCDRSLWSSLSITPARSRYPRRGGRRQLRSSSLRAPVAVCTAAVSPSIARAIAKSPSTMFDGSPSRSGSLGEISAAFKAPTIWVWSFSVIGLYLFGRTS
jgi:hypothetical protein